MIGVTREMRGVVDLIEMVSESEILARVDFKRQDNPFQKGGGMREANSNKPCSIAIFSL